MWGRILPKVIWTTATSIELSISLDFYQHLRSGKAMGIPRIYDDSRMKVAILGALFIVAYWVPLKGMVNVWVTNEDYSYGFLIPFISVYLFWEKRTQIKEIVLRSYWLAFPGLIFFVLLSLYGVLGSSGNVAMPAIPFLIILFAAFCFGKELTKKAILPLGFLFFMIPLPPVLDRTFGVFLKSVSSQLGAFFIRAVGISVHLSGNILDLGVSKLQVVDACSGLRFVFPLMALGLIYGYFFERILWKKIFFFFVTIPIAIFTNGLRIGITGVLTNIYGTEVAEGFFHGFSGWAIFMVAFVFLFLLGRLMRLFFPKKNADPKGKVVTTHEGTDVLPTVKNRKLSGFIVSVVLLLIVAGLTWNTKAMPPVHIEGGIESFPLKFSGWEGKQIPVDDEITIESGAEEAFSAVYRDSNNNSVSLYMGYRSTAFLENENFFHSPTVCLPASGWKTRNKTTHIIPDVPFYKELKVTQMLVDMMGQRQLVYFWFQTKDKASHDKNINRFHLAMHAVSKDNTHDLFIRPITAINSDESIEDAEERMEGFVRDMMRTLLEFLEKRQTGRQ